MQRLFLCYIRWYIFKWLRGWKITKDFSHDKQTPTKNRNGYISRSTPIRYLTRPVIYKLFLIRYTKQTYRGHLCQLVPSDFSWQHHKFIFRVPLIFFETIFLIFTHVMDQPTSLSTAAPDGPAVIPGTNVDFCCKLTGGKGSTGTKRGLLSLCQPQIPCRLPRVWTCPCALREWRLTV